MKCLISGVFFFFIHICEMKLSISWRATFFFNYIVKKIKDIKKKRTLELFNTTPLIFGGVIKVCDIHYLIFFNASSL